MKRTCITCFYHKDERGHITCGFNGHCIFGDCYTPMRGSLEEIEMVVEPWKKAQALYEAKLLNRHDGIFADAIIDINRVDIGRSNDKAVISIYDKLHKTIDAHILSTDNPDTQSWLRSFMAKEENKD